MRFSNILPKKASKTLKNSWKALILQKYFYDESHCFMLFFNVNCCFLMEVGFFTEFFEILGKQSDFQPKHGFPGSMAFF